LYHPSTFKSPFSQSSLLTLRPFIQESSAKGIGHFYKTCRHSYPTHFGLQGWLAKPCSQPSGD
jgi:hypothetical protein